MKKLYTIDWQYLNNREKIMNHQQMITSTHLQVAEGDVLQPSALSADLNTVDILPSTEGKRLDLALTLDDVDFQSQFQEATVQIKQLIVKLSVPIIINATDIELDNDKPLVNLQTEIDSKSLFLNSEFELLLHKGLHKNNRLASIVRQISNQKLVSGKEYTNMCAGVIKTEEDVSTLGWDVVSASSFSNINKQIELQNTFPQNIKASYEDNIAGKATIEGLFKIWEMSTSGDGKNVTFKCTFKSPTKIDFETSKQSPTIPLDETNWFEVQVPLATFDDQHDHHDNTGKNDGQFKTLKISKLDDADESNIIMIDEAYPDEIDDSSTLTAMTTALLKKYIENLSHDKTTLQHIFSFLQLGETANDPRWQWLKAKESSYAVATTNSLDTSVFAVMYQTASDQSPDTQEADPRLLDKASSGQSVIAMSKLIYFKNVIYEALPYAQMLPQSEVNLDLENLVLTNNAPFDYAFLKDNNTKITVDKDQFKLGFFNNELQLSVTGQEPFTEANRTGVLHHYVMEKMSLAFKDGGIWLNEGESEFTTTVESKTIDSDWFSWESFAIGIAVGFALGGLCYAAYRYGAKIAGLVRFTSSDDSESTILFRRGNNFFDTEGNQAGADIDWDDQVELRQFAINRNSEQTNELRSTYSTQRYNAKSNADHIISRPEQERARMVDNFSDRYDRDTALIKTGLLSRCTPFSPDNGVQSLNSVRNQAVIDLIGTDGAEGDVSPVGIDAFWQAITNTIQWPEQSEIEVTDVYCNGVVTIQGAVK